jgi:hypothetical protein
VFGDIMGDVELFQRYHQQRDEIAKLLVEKENAQKETIQVSLFLSLSLSLSLLWTHAVLNLGEKNGNGEAERSGGKVCGQTGRIEEKVCGDARQHESRIGKKVELVRKDCFLSY